METKLAFCFPGRFGWALALLLARFFQIDVFVRDAEKAAKWQAAGCCDLNEWLQKLPFPDSLTVYGIERFDPKPYDYVFLAPPIEFLADDVHMLAQKHTPDTRYVTVQKGLRNGLNAIEIVLEQLPGAIVISCIGAATARDVSQSFFGMIVNGPWDCREDFKLLLRQAGIIAVTSIYWQEIAVISMLRTVLSLLQGLVTGIVTRFGYSESTCYFITIGCESEYQRLAGVYGVMPTFFQIEERLVRILLADIRICDNAESRNWQYGYLRGSGMTHEEALFHCDGVAEGVGNMEELLVHLRTRHPGFEEMFPLLGIAEAFLKDNDTEAAMAKLKKRAETW